ncbi:hypothetical protein [Streptomyces globisporus]
MTLMARPAVLRDLVDEYALAAARHQLPGTRPLDDSVLSSS